MAGLINKIFRVCLFAIIAPAVAFGGQSPRTTSSKVLTRNQSLDNNTIIRRSATSVIARSASANARRSGKTVIARPAIARTASNLSVRSGARVVSSGSNLSRAAVSKSGTARSSVNRSAKNTNINNHVSRAASSRATAVFNDVTKIGGGYSNCRDAYATCMDQFCANADDSYRRCFCSNKFQNFRDMSDNLDQALGMLADFQNNNLNVVDKTTAEVDAMYSSTAGEDAIKKDTSASQKLLDEIGDILSGKKSSSTKNTSVSLGIINFGSFSDVGDIWSDSGSSSIFNQRSVDDISGLEGDALYKRASSQCAAITRDSCSSDALFNLASSAYSIMVTQDCNVVEKSINAKKESVTQTVRKAESLLREARLEEYRAHNSQDVNECLEKVEEAMTQPLVCGENYIKCLDYTGKYINATTGEPIYNELFNISSIAPNLVDGDIIAANSRWSQELENKRQYAATALDTCRSLAEDVWYEFKRMTLIRIAQKQDEVVQNAKDSCISVIKDCYNNQTGELNEFVEVDDQYNFGAGAVVMARATCYDKVMACAALYGDADGCQYDRATKKISAIKDKKCGLQALLTFVDTVDSSKVAAECETTLTARAHELCTPTSGTYKIDANGNYIMDSLTGDRVLAKYPDRCANMPKSQLRADLTEWANKFCALDMVRDDASATFNTDIANRVIKNIFDELGLGFAVGCEEKNGVWYDDNVAVIFESGALTVSDLNEDFYNTYYGGTSSQSILSSVKAGDIGLCLANLTPEQICEKLPGGIQTGFDSQTRQCTLSPNHRAELCSWLGGKPGKNNDQCNLLSTFKIGEGKNIYIGKYSAKEYSQSLKDWTQANKLGKWKMADHE